MNDLSKPIPSSVAWLYAQTEALERIRLERDLEEAEFIAFCDSMKAGDTQAAQIGYFGNRFRILSDRWHLEHDRYCACGADLEDGEEICDDCAAKFRFAERGYFRRNA